MGGKCDIKCDVGQTEKDSGHPSIPNAVDQRPGRIITLKGRFRFFLMQQIIEIDIFSLYRHGPYILKKMGGMGIFFRVAVGMVHPMEDRIGPRIEKGRTL